MAEADDTQIASTFDWTDKIPTPAVRKDLKVDRRTYHYFKSMTLKDIKALRPCDKKWNKEDQQQLFEKLKGVLANNVDEDAETVTLRTCYCTPKTGFPGRLYSPNGVQCLIGCIRANLLQNTSDMDMSKAMHRVLKWVCAQLNVPTPHLDYYIEHRDGNDGVLQRMMNADGVSKKKAKELYTMIWTACKPINTRNAHLRDCDKEAKQVQQALMAKPELAWILPYCKEENRPGSFISHLYHWIEAKLLSAVHSMLEGKSLEVAALIFDGINIIGRSHFGNATLLEDAHAACEAVCPGINMIWAWKPLDFTVSSKDTRKELKELRVPDEYQPPPPLQRNECDEKDDVLDPETEPTYEEMRAEFSLNLGGNKGKVGSEYICVLEDGALELIDTKHFRDRYAHYVYFELVEEEDPETKVTYMVKVKHPFLDRWMRDERMDPRYLHDKSKRYFWDRFDMYPDASKCPDNVYNLWKGFAAEKMETDLDDNNVRNGLLLILEHFKMLCSGDKPAYDFMLNILAHALQYPNVKLGIMLCLVGPQGCGKGHVWDIIQRLIGGETTTQTFSTDEPQKDVWGDNNGRMKNAFFVRIAEVAKSAFSGMVGKMRGKITDNPIRVRDLYCTATNVKSYARFFLDTNYRDAIPDEHGERRFFITDCNEEKIGDDGYWVALRDAIADDRVIRALYDFLIVRDIKPMYLGKDIPIGAYQKVLKDTRRSVVEQFLEWLVEIQDLNNTTLTLNNDQLYAKFKQWQDSGNEWDRSKASITRELQLSSIKGIKMTKPRVESIVLGRSTLKQVRTYIFDLVELRKRYGVDQPTAPLAPSVTIDCAKEIEEWINSIPKDQEGEENASEDDGASEAEADDEDYGMQDADSQDEAVGSSSDDEGVEEDAQALPRQAAKRARDESDDDDDDDSGHEMEDADDDVVNDDDGSVAEDAKA